ncbi:unnamed protein product [Adineta steineri]|uniref:Uncharacterized protein n=1 Tax=Adineta steineri TaxID=433720 RepID=A0A818KSK3_9BILA|nr:unnamed protein product [Adineta steineri]
MSKYCQVLFSRIDNNQSDSTSIISSTENYESSPISFVPTQSASFLPISPLSKTESIASLESSSKSAFPIGRLTSQIDHTEPRHIPNKDMLNINEYKKSQLIKVVPNCPSSSTTRKRRDVMVAICLLIAMFCLGFIIGLTCGTLRRR